MTTEERIKTLSAELILQLALYKESLKTDEPFDLRKPITARMKEIENELEQHKTSAPRTN